MEKAIKLMQAKFGEIKKMGYVKSIRRGSTGIGATFEYLLEKEEESFPIPDFYGIEIKTKRSYSNAYITLFNAVPTGSMYHELKRLRDTYGYPDPDDAHLKRLNIEVSANELNKIGCRYYSKLLVNKKEERIYLYIYNRQKRLIDTSTYWDFDILAEKLYQKLQVLALVKAWPSIIGGYEYFNYYKMNIYILKNFDCFIDLIHKGDIKIIIKAGSYRDKKRYGKVAGHGVSFCIQEENLLKLFDIYR